MSNVSTKITPLPIQCNREPMNLARTKKAPAATGASQLAQQCKLKDNTITLVARSKFTRNVICDRGLIGSFLSFSRVNAFTESVTL